MLPQPIVQVVTEAIAFAFGYFENFSLERAGFLRGLLLALSRRPQSTTEYADEDSVNHKHKSASLLGRTSEIESKVGKGEKEVSRDHR
jgi:hypothetical protein